MALISVNSTLPGLMYAGEQSERIKGRPGVNPLRTKQNISLEADDYEKIKEIIAKSGVNASRVIARREGYFGVVDDTQYIGPVTFTCGTETKFTRKINEADLLSDFIARSEKFGTKIVRNDDGSYDCRWH